MKHVLFGLLFTSLVASSCRKQPEQKTETTAPAPQTVAKPAEAAVKLMFSFPPSAEPSKESKAAAKKLTELVAEKSGFAIEAMFPKTYAEAITALKKKDAQVVLLSGWAYLKAHHSADADLLLAEERDGAASFQAQWFVAKDSKIEKLSDLRKKRIAFTSPTSASGFLLPYAKLIQEGVLKSGTDLQKEFSEVYFTGGQSEALGVLLEGKVDAAAGAAFAPKIYLSDEDQAKVRTLASVDGAPTHVLAVRADIDMKVRDKLKEVFLGLNADQKDLLVAAYGTQKLIERSHGDHLTAIQEAQELVGTEYLMPEEPEPEVKAPEVPKGVEEAPKPK